MFCLTAPKRRRKCSATRTKVKNKTLYFFTNSFPYGGESFVGNEIEAQAREYSQIVLIPSAKGQVKNSLPANVEVVNLELAKLSRWSLLAKNLPLIIKIFSLDYKRNTDKAGVKKKWRYNLSVLLNTIAISESLKQLVEKDRGEKAFVSFWMDQWSLALSILKYKGIIKNFFYRVHQHDLYVDGHPDYYIPFRFFNMQQASGVFPDSERGVAFLKSLNFFPQKIKTGHLGVPDRGTNPFSDKEFVMVSCSALVARKRVELIADVLSLVKIPVTWIHFGKIGDSPESFTNLEARCKSLPSNIKVILKGDVSYPELIKFYQEQPVNLFIALSRAEGLPVSIMEAVSFGIPVLATDTMGIKDIVGEETGILIDIDTKKEAIAGLIESFMSGSKNTPEFRKTVKAFWSKKFNSERNYSIFNQCIEELSK